MTSLPLHALAASEAQPSPSEEVDFDVHVGDMREVLAGFEPDSFDSLVTDPPYGLSFMGKGWDKGVPGDEFWKEALRVAKPGAHLLAFGGTRTYHRLMCAIEDAGWEIRDCIMWVHSQGFPKSHSIGKAIDREAGAEREKVLVSTTATNKPYLAVSATYSHSKHAGFRDISAPITDAAKQWEGWGTALKPSWEPIIVARKPLEGTVAQNVLKHGTGGMNIEACRVGDTVETWPKTRSYPLRKLGLEGGSTYGSENAPTELTQNTPAGRWPANLIHDGSEEVVSLFPADAGGGFGVRGAHSSEHLKGKKATYEQVGFGDSGSAARFFYCAKTTKKDRGADNRHPTVKPTDLMRYCVKLVTPVGGVVLDPFMGSGSTGKGALLEGMNFVGVELDPEYAKIAIARLNAAQTKRNSAC